MRHRNRQLPRLLCAALSLPWFVAQAAFADVSTITSATSASTTTTGLHHHHWSGSSTGVSSSTGAAHGWSHTTSGLGALPQGTSLDLSSAKAVIAAPNTSALTIQVGGTLGAHGINGGSAMTVNPGQMLTAAEYLAVTQAMHGTQHLLLTTQGIADGGTARIGANTITSALSSLVIPANVTLTSVGFGKSDPLTVSGLTTVGGTLQAVQWQPNTASYLNFGSLDVLTGGLITTTAAAGSHLFSSSALNLTVAHNFTNSGTISSSGSLNVLTNGGAITNNGLISAQGALNLASSAPALNIAGAGTIQSVSNAININAATLGNNLNINFAGENLLSSALNINAGTAGAVTGALGNVTGALNETAGTSNLTTQSNALTLGGINIQGDPTYYNSGGSVLISSPIVIGAGADLAIAASDSIQFLAGSSITTAGGNVLLVSGANITPAGSSLPPTDGGKITISGASSATGGEIYNIASAPIATNGGNLTMVAMGSSGQILNDGFINTGGGNLTAIANTGVAFTAPINTSGGTGTGNVSLYSATPTQTAPVVINSGTVVSGAFTPGATQSGPIQVASVTTPSGATVTAVTNGGFLVLAPTLNLGATNYDINAGSSQATFRSFFGDMTMGTGTITSHGTGQVNFNASGNIDFTSAAAANANVINANSPVVFAGDTVKFGAGALTFTTSGTADGALQAGAVLKGSTGITMPGSGGTLTLNFKGSGGALYDNSTGANFQGIGATNLVINNTGGDTHIFGAGTMNNRGGSMTLSVPSSGGYYQSELQLMGTGTNYLSNITSSGGPLNISSPGSFDLSGTIANNFPQQPLAGGITVSSGYTCSNCSNLQTGIVVEPNAQILAQGGYIMLTVSNTNTTTPADPTKAMISIGNGAVIHSYGWITGGYLSGGGVQISVNNYPAAGLYGLLTGNRNVTYTYPGYGTIQQLDTGSKQTGVPLLTARMNGGGTYQADSEGIVAIDSSHVPGLIQGTGFVNGTGGVVYVGGASYAGEIVINGSVIGSYPAAAPPPASGGGVLVAPSIVTAGGGGTVGTAAAPVTFNTPGLSQLPQTDTTRSAVMIAASLNQPFPQTVNLSSQSASAFVAGTCQKFLIGDDKENDDKKTFAVALTGSTLAVDSVPQNGNSNPVLDLQRGRLLVITGDQGLDVHTAQGTFVIPAHSSSILAQDEDGQASAVALSGGDVTAKLSGATVNQIKVPVGQWLLASAQGGQIVANATYEVLGITKLADSLRNVELRKVNLATVLACDHVSVCVVDNGKKDLDRMLKQKLDQIQQSFKASSPAGPVSIINGNRLSINSEQDSALPPVDPHLVPVAFGAPPPAMNTQFTTLRMPTAVAKSYGNASLAADGKGNLLLGQGEVLLQCNSKTTLVAGKNTATIEPGTTVLAKYERGILFISDLWERTDKAIHLVGPTRTIRIGVAEQAISGYSIDILDALAGDATGRRRIRELVSNTPGGGIAWCDVSIQSLMQFDPLLRSIRRSKYSDDQSLTERFIKMAAVINTVDYDRGVYNSFH